MPFKITPRTPKTSFCSRHRRCEDAFSAPRRRMPCTRILFLLSYPLGYLLYCGVYTYFLISIGICASETLRELNILDHDRYSLAVNGTEVPAASTGTAKKTHSTNVRQRGDTLRNPPRTRSSFSPATVELRGSWGQMMQMPLFGDITCIVIRERVKKKHIHEKKEDSRIFEEGSQILFSCSLQSPKGLRLPTQALDSFHFCGDLSHLDNNKLRLFFAETQLRETGDENTYFGGRPS